MGEFKNILSEYSLQARVKHPWLFPIIPNIGFKQYIFLMYTLLTKLCRNEKFKPSMADGHLCAYWLAADFLRDG